MEKVVYFSYTRNPIIFCFKLLPNLHKIFQYPGNIPWKKEKMHLMIKILLAITTITLLSINPVFSQTSTPSDYPVYKDGKLTIPRVDTDVQTGNYQQVEFQFDNSSNSWKLINYIETKITPGPATYEEKVEAIITDSSPVQVFLKISGAFAHGCAFFQQINQTLKNNKFEITLHVGPNPFPPDIACTAALVPYEKIIPLEVYGLPAGTYEYSVNDEHNGAFTLTKDNTL